MIHKHMVASRRQNMQMTFLRTKIIDVCIGNSRPLTIPEIQELLRMEKITPHKTSLYRNIEFLCKQNLLNEVMLDANAKHYETTTVHHHHVVCTECSSIHCVVDRTMEKIVQKMEREIAKKMHFHVRDHQFSFFGVCNECFCN